MSDIFSDKSIGRISSLLTEPQSGVVREGLEGRSQSFSSNNDALSKILNINNNLWFEFLWPVQCRLSDTCKFSTQYKDDYTYTQLKEFYSPQKTLAFNTVINYY